MELIVTAAILSIMMAILMPVLHSVKQQAKTIQCSVNIKSLLLAFTLYETENESLPYGFYDDRSLSPPPGGYAGNKKFDRAGWWWFDYLEIFFDENRKNRDIIRCPSKCLSDPAFEDTCGNYGANQSICKVVSGRGFHAEFEGIPLSLSDIESPSRTLLIADAGYALINWWHVTKHPPGRLRSFLIEDSSYIPGLSINIDREPEYWPGQETDAFWGRHPNKTVNIGFADGHVNKRNADDLLVEKLADDQYKNLSPLWLPK